MSTTAIIVGALSCASFIAPASAPTGAPAASGIQEDAFVVREPQVRFITCDAEDIDRLCTLTTGILEQASQQNRVRLIRMPDLELIVAVGTPSAVQIAQQSVRAFEEAIERRDRRRADAAEASPTSETPKTPETTSASTSVRLAASTSRDQPSDRDGILRRISEVARLRIDADTPAAEKAALGVEHHELLRRLRDHRPPASRGRIR